MIRLPFSRAFLNGAVAAGGGDRIVVRQLVELQKQIPSLYLLLMVNAGALGFSLHGVAPVELTVWVPGISIPFCLLRAVHWWRLSAHAATEAEAFRRLRVTIALTAILALAFVGWAMALSQYGGAPEQAHVAIFVAITVVACIFCLTHLPVAAFVTTFIVLGVFQVSCLTSTSPVFIGIALNVAFVTVVMIRVLAGNFLTFVRLVEAEGQAQRLAEENARLAHTDSLTGLPNRRFFFQHLDALIAEQDRHETGFALAIFDLDRFKPINDTYGHIAGDRVLSETGRRLAELSSDSVAIARLGGDEFGVLIRAPGSDAEVVAFCDRICAALQEPVRCGGTQVSTGCSGGLALYPRAGRTADALFDRADYALYHAKEGERGRTALFSQAHEDVIRAERAVETALRSADLAAEMELHYQPIFDTRTDAIVMVEGLARWTSPTLGRVPPDRFIAAAERGGMIHGLTLLLLRKALADAARLPPEVGLSFNLSSHDLASPETVLAILAAIRGSGIAPARITLELTETALMLDFGRAQEAIIGLHALGVKIALDDFGTGYSSLSYVHRLPLDKVKIDRSFMADIDTDLGRGVVGSILDLCQNLGLDGVAEGVETPEQLAAMRRQGCRYVQGYLIGAPMPLPALLARLGSEAPPAADRRSA